MTSLKKKKNYVKILNKNKYYFLMVLPAVIAVFIFCYIPMYGVLIAFQDCDLSTSFIFSSPCILEER